MERKQSFFGGRAVIERRQQAHRGVEDCGFGFVVRHTLPNDRQGCTGGPNRLEASEDGVERAVDRHLLQMRELTTARSEMRVHQDVGLQGPTESALTLSRAPGKRGELPVVLGQESDDSVGVAIVDGPQ